MHLSTFEKIKKESCNSVTSHHFDVKVGTREKCDASHLGFCASLKQDHGRIWKTVVFAGRFLEIAELKYSTDEHELVGLVWALDLFKNYVLGQQFSNSRITKQYLKPLMIIKTQKWPNLVFPVRQIRFYLTQFTVEHLSNKEMRFEDYLPRHSFSSIINF